MMEALERMLVRSLSFDSSAIEDFDPAGAAIRMIGTIAIPLFSLFAVTIVAAVGTPAVLGSLGFRWSAIGFKANKLDPLAGMKRIFGAQGLIELAKSMAKVVLLGAVGVWLLTGRAGELMTLGRQDIGPRSASLAAPSSSRCW
jgi:flagellar biosynthetic protein FlhB